MFFRHFDKLKSFSGKEKANKTYDFAKPYFVMVMNFVWIISYGTAIYVFDALNTLRIQARKEPFIALAALATIIYAVFAYNQWQVMRGQLDEMQTESAIRRDELMARMKFAFAAGLKFENLPISPTWDNVGKTDAVDFGGWDDFKIFSAADEVNEFDFIAKSKSAILDYSNVVIPGEKLTGISREITSLQAWKAIYGQIVIVFWGYREYKDIFKLFHTVRYCAYVNVKVNAQGAIGLNLPGALRADCNRRT